ncbi:MAG: hypothetical protein ACO3A2_01740, partial [Bdellovibrionia bacterium]
MGGPQEDPDEDFKIEQIQRLILEMDGSDRQKAQRLLRSSQRLNWSPKAQQVLLSEVLRLAKQLADPGLEAEAERRLSSCSPSGVAPSDPLCPPESVAPDPEQGHSKRTEDSDARTRAQATQLLNLAFSNPDRMELRKKALKKAFDLAQQIQDTQLQAEALLGLVVCEDTTEAEKK